jgi:PAS domain S-box-containing protein
MATSLEQRVGIGFAVAAALLVAAVLALHFGPPRLVSTLLFDVVAVALALGLSGGGLWVLRGEMARRRQAESSARESASRLQAIIDNTTVVAYIKDLHGRLVFVNRRFLELNRKSREDVEGHFDHEIFDAPTLAVFRADDDKVLAASGPLSFERTVTLPDGVHNFLSNKCALRDEHGKPFAICATSTDITALKRAEVDAHRLQLFLDSIVENLPDMIFVKDADELRFVRLNKAGEELLGFDREALLGKNDYDFFPREQAEFFVARDREVLRSGEILDIPEEPISTKDHGRRLLHTKKVAIQDERGRARYLLGISRDITQIREAEHKIRALHESVAEHARQLEVANRELEAFSYSVSHDLRAPLRHMDGFADLLRRQAWDTLDEKSRKYLDYVTDAAKVMGALIDDLLVFSRMGRVEMQSTHVELGELVAEVRKSLEAGTSGRSIAWRVGALPAVQADPSMMRQVLVNLLGNAIKYSSKNPDARIEIGTRESDTETTLFVRDNGVGFDMAYAGKLFGVFQRLHRAEEFEGTGIGLANVRRIIERHGGRAWAEGEVGKGATFFVSLPKRLHSDESAREAA